MTHLSTTYPDDLWGSAAREHARREASELNAIRTEQQTRGLETAMKRSKAIRDRKAYADCWKCTTCDRRNTASRTWCIECGDDR